MRTNVEMTFAPLTWSLWQQFSYYLECIALNEVLEYAQYPEQGQGMGKVKAMAMASMHHLHPSHVYMYTHQVQPVSDDIGAANCQQPELAAALSLSRRMNWMAMGPKKVWG